MKKQVYKSKSLILSILLVFTGLTLYAQEARKEITKTYDIRKGVTLSTETRYSDIELVTWDRDVVDILAEISVEASSKNRAEDRLEKIDISIEKSGNTISLETEFENGWSSNVKTEIRITIKAPSYINLDAENSYGDLFIQEVSGLVLLDLKYSNLKAGVLSRGNVRPVNQIEIAYSNGSIEEAGWIEMELAYSDMEIETAEMLSMESKYSKLIGERIGAVSTEGAYDKYYIDDINEFKAELKYSGIKFGTLHKKFNLESTYTGAKINSLSRGFEQVNASLAYGNITIDVEDNASFKLDGESKYGKIHVGPEGRLSKQKEGTRMRVSGQVGNNPKGSMNLVTKYGNITIE